jgi:RimJ/RimL family protein N-acetyltransferase
MPRAPGRQQPVTVTIPTLVTPRLTLRPIHNQDVAGYAAIWADPEFTRHIGGRSDYDGIWHAMAGNIGCWALTGVGPWSVVERATGDLVGRAGLWDEPGWPGVEAVWFIGCPWWGRGFATEAGAAAISWVFADRPDLHQVVSTILPANDRSIRVAERLGMRLDRVEHLHGADHAIYAVDRATWTEARSRTGDTA